MALWRSPSTGFSTHKLPPPAPLMWLFTTRDGYFRWVVYRKGTYRGLTLSCSAKNLGGGKKQRQSRASMSDSDLRKELIDFVSGEGLPEGHIPSTTELSKRGRQDLANIVRRKGYKTIAELLTNQVYDSANPPQSLPDSIGYEHRHNVHNESPEVSAEAINGGSAGQLIELRENALDGFITSGVPQFRNDAIPRNNLSNECYGVISLEVDETDKQAEIEKLRVMLQEKEMELLQLRQEIEKEKLALSIFQNKASAEMEYIHNLLSQKDSEISASEERLLGLKEVLVEYQGQGHEVEIAGSFNGWHHRVKLDRHTSVNLDSVEDRDVNCWVATLWLYPGIYEVKFVVDGHWKTDPRRETITRGHITNNVIRVER